MPRPKFKATPKQLKQVKHFASIGLLKKDIAAMLGYNANYFAEVLKNPDIQNAYLTGIADGKAELLNASIRRATDDRRKDCTANAHYLLNRLERDSDVGVESVDTTVDVDTAIASITLELNGKSNVC